MLTSNHKEIMISSYRNISFNPEKRGESDFQHYSQLLENDLLIIGEYNNGHNKYAEKFISKLILIYNHRSNTASAMITGPARFPTSKNNKRLDWEMKAIDKFVQWRERYLNLVTRIRRATIQESLDKHLNKAETSQYSRERVRELEARQELSQKFEGFTMACGGVVTLNNERLVITHDSKPSIEVLSLIKKRGFKYSPKTKTWVRQFTGNALMSVEILRDEIEKIKD